MFQTFISRHNSNFFSDKLVLTSVTPASSAPVLQTPKATSSTLYFDSLTVNAGNGGFLHCIQMDTSVNAANQVVSVGADIAFDADPKFFACLVRFESSSVPTTLPTAYDVYPLDGRHDGGYYTVKDCVTIDVLPRTPVNNVYVCFMVWSNFTATKCRGFVSFFFQAEDGIRDWSVTGVQTCALPIYPQPSLFPFNGWHLASSSSPLLQPLILVRVPSSRSVLPTSPVPPIQSSPAPSNTRPPFPAPPAHTQPTPHRESLARSAFRPRN